MIIEINTPYQPQQTKVPMIFPIGFLTGGILGRLGYPDRDCQPICAYIHSSDFVASKHSHVRFVFYDISIFHGD